MKRLRLPALLILAVWGIWSAAFLRAADADPRTRFLRAVQNLEQRRYADSLADLVELRREDPGNARVNYYLGRAYYETGHPQKAERFFLRAIQLNPGLAAAHLYLGRIALRWGYLKTARKEIGLALRLDNGMADAHYWMGHCLEAQKRLSGAAKEYRMAFRLDSRQAREKRALKRLKHSEKNRRAHATEAMG